MSNDLNRLSSILEDNISDENLPDNYQVEISDLSYSLTKIFLEYREFKAMCTLNRFTESGIVKLSDAEIIELYKFTKQTYKTEE